MKAMVYHQYGSPDMLGLEEVEKPVPGKGEVLVKVYATSITAGDWIFLKGENFMVRLMAGGITKPTKIILGVDMAGRVEATGPGVTQFQPGSEVYGEIFSAGLGGFAEYVTVPEKLLALKPKNLTFEQTAAVPVAGMTALQGLRDKARLQAGQKILITGASGGVGTFAIQLARHFGAEVTATCSTGKIDFIRSLGVQHVADYSQEDITKNGQQYDAILDIAAYRPFSDYKPILKPDGRYIMVGGSFENIYRRMFLGPFASMMGKQTFDGVMQKSDQKDLLVLKELLEAGKIVPVIDSCYPLEEIAKGFRRIGDRHVQGRVVITVTQDNR